MSVVKPLARQGNKVFVQFQQGSDRDRCTTHIRSSEVYMMKSIILAVTMLAGFATGAVAADTVDGLPVSSIYNWSGAYVGGHAGYAWGRTKYNDPLVFDEISFLRKDGDGFLGGVQAGYNWQDGAVVYGIEGDVSFGNVKGHRFLVTAYGPANYDETLRVFGTFRGKVGYTFNSILPYVTGGFAVANYKLEGAGGSTTTTNLGWTIGGGAEIGLTEKISIKGEYLFADVGKEDFSLANAPDVVPFPGKVSAEIQTLRIGINYRF
ncbi:MULTISPECIES: outer membrane protein [unclassified Mesorhizobium]|uniref:outer membrane protein n=1 Tax=unclassified Mesorhizobium TaxID=325217 RepID=UPI0015E365C6|nr:MULTISPECIES: outer membrane protein [unclassified Mesorhizobium]